MPARAASGRAGGGGRSLAPMPIPDVEEQPGDHDVPADLLELFEVIEWLDAVKGKQ